MRDSGTYLITGATSGLGLEAARALARDGRRRVLAGARNPAASALRAAVPPERLTVLDLDVGSLASVRAFAAEARRHLGRGGARLSGIACNAGLQLVGPPRRSPDGHELTFATNHLGHFLLVYELLDLLAPGAAVVGTASGTHDPADRLARRFGFRGGIFPGAEAVARGELDPSAPEKQQGMDRYATSKLCAILFAYAMAARVPASAARFLAFDPGLTPGTGLARDLSATERFAWSHVMPLVGQAVPGVSSPARSGAALARLLSEPGLAPGTGLHFDFRLRQTPTSELSRRKDAQDDLHRTSLALCGIAEARPAASAA
ncbi:protochlorophyllide reductase [Craurococcus roseus]|uniref:Protochlorophyllide reductase n=1 Tax=Craurococcus roseus TaxID=77585 RepID=A0ABN1EW77_9PROT